VLLSDDKRTRDYTPEQYLKTTGQMQQLFADLPEAISNTLVVARRCNIEFEFGKLGCCHGLPLLGAQIIDGLASGFTLFKESISFTLNQIALCYASFVSR